MCIRQVVPSCSSVQYDPLIPRACRSLRGRSYFAHRASFLDNCGAKACSGPVICYPTQFVPYQSAGLRRILSYSTFPAYFVAAFFFSPGSPF